MHKRNLHAQLTTVCLRATTKATSIDYGSGKAYIHTVHNDDEWLYYASHLRSATPMVGTQFE